MRADYKKITQALNLLAKKEGGKINKMKAIKLIWMADRLNLREFGKPITGDDYCAMEYGPVGSVTRNLTDEVASYLSDDQLGYSQKYIKKIDPNNYQSINDVDLSVFSENDIKSIEKVYDIFGSLDQFKLAQISHEAPEWKKFEKQITSGNISQAQMDYLDFFNVINSEIYQNEQYKNGIDKIFNQDVEKIAISRAIFEEQREVENLWA